jgi:hypothetical protein
MFLELQENIDTVDFLLKKRSDLVKIGIKKEIKKIDFYSKFISGMGIHCLEILFEKDSFKEKYPKLVDYFFDNEDLTDNYFYVEFYSYSDYLDLLKDNHYNFLIKYQDNIKEIFNYFDLINNYIPFYFDSSEPIFYESIKNYYDLNSEEFKFILFRNINNSGLFNYIQYEYPDLKNEISSFNFLKRDLFRNYLYDYLYNSIKDELDLSLDMDSKSLNFKIIHSFKNLTNLISIIRNIYKVEPTYAYKILKMFLNNDIDSINNLSNIKNREKLKKELGKYDLENFRQYDFKKIDFVISCKEKSVSFDLIYILKEVVSKVNSN